LSFKGSVFSRVANPNPFYTDLKPDPDPAFHFDADPDPDFHFDADSDPDPDFHFDADPDLDPYRFKEVM
jgi:hypothetical protein